LKERSWKKEAGSHYLMGIHYWLPLKAKQTISENLLLFLQKLFLKKILKIILWISIHKAAISIIMLINL
jgi:hypothetical protein